MPCLLVRLPHLVAGVAIIVPLLFYRTLLYPLIFIRAGSLGAALRGLPQAVPLRADESGLPDRLQGGKCWVPCFLLAPARGSSAVSGEVGALVRCQSCAAHVARLQLV